MSCHYCKDCDCNKKLNDAIKESRNPVKRKSICVMTANLNLDSGKGNNPDFSHKSMLI